MHGGRVVALAYWGELLLALGERANNRCVGTVNLPTDLNKLVRARTLIAAC